MATNESDMLDTAKHIDRLLGLLAGRLQGERETALSFVKEDYTQCVSRVLHHTSSLKQSYVQGACCGALKIGRDEERRPHPSLREQH